jgi:hypothetical protein
MDCKDTPGCANDHERIRKLQLKCVRPVPYLRSIMKWSTPSNFCSQSVSAIRAPAVTNVRPPWSRPRGIQLRLEAFGVLDTPVQPSELDQTTHFLRARIECSILRSLAKEGLPFDYQSSCADRSSVARSV